MGKIMPINKKVFLLKINGSNDEDKEWMWYQVITVQISTPTPENTTDFSGDYTP